MKNTDLHTHSYYSDGALSPTKLVQLAKKRRIKSMALTDHNSVKGVQEAIREGKIDIISMNRRVIADPEAPKKVLEGRLDDIRPCTSCMTCFNLGEHFKPVACRVNSSMGKEREYEIKPAETRNTPEYFRK